MIDFSKLDRTIHERGRLSIMTLLATKPQWSFADLKSQLGMSDGNLITHLRALSKVEYVEVEKEQGGKGRPRSLYALTKGGRKAFEEYLQVLEEIVQANR